MPQISTVNQFAGKYPAFTEPSLRWLLFKANENGLAASGAILRNGRRVLIDDEKFFAWLASRQQSAA